MTLLALLAGVGHHGEVVVGGPLAAQTPSPPPRGEVVIFRGIVGYWPRVERLEKQLQDYGFSSRVVFNVERGSLAGEIRGRVARGETRGPVAIVGYSLGGINAILLARDLQADNIRVPMMVLVDPPVVSDIPSNVGRCLNLYKSHPVGNLVPEWVPIMRGIPVRKWSSPTEVVNRDLARKDPVFGLLYDNHLTVASTDEVQDQIARAIATGAPASDEPMRRQDGQSSGTSLGLGTLRP
jgi:pimeloyl-ACP methyl ester carboxylesterase